ncbi:MAG: aldo/keto reductase [Saprospiraceae bacterium]|nr:aldo/keto reductase [Saprospiraceae bacterium]
MNFPTILLGTAMWGWTVPRETCFALLDAFYGAGFREVDTATNYPINKNPADFRAAENLLLEWIQTHGIHDLKTTVKVGSIDNLRSPDHNLSKSFLLMSLDDYGYRFGSNLHTLAIHWDNRDDEAAIRSTLEALAVARKKGLHAGLSGIRFPELYARLNAEPAFGFDFRIQIKHNLLQSDYERYAAFQGSRRFLAYGIHAGGIKLDPAGYSPDSSLRARGGDTEVVPPRMEHLKTWLAGQPQAPSFHYAAMLYAAYSPDMAGIILGPSSVQQLKDSMAVYRSLREEDAAGLYEALKAV